MQFGVLWVSAVMLGWSVAVPLCRFRVHSKRYSVLSFGVRSWRCRFFWPGHLGIDILNVVRSVGRLLDRGCLSKHLPLVKDGISLLLFSILKRAWGPDTVKVSKVKGHAAEADVTQGRVRMEDRLGNAEADTAADLGRRHQSQAVMGRSLLNARNHRHSIGSWLRFPGFLSIMVNGVVRPRIPLSGIKGVGKSSASLMLGLILFLHHFLGNLIPCTGPGYRFMEREEEVYWCGYCCLALQRKLAVQARCFLWDTAFAC